LGLRQTHLENYAILLSWVFHSFENVINYPFLKKLMTFQRRMS